MEATYNQALRALRDQLKSIDSFTTFEPCEENEIALSTVARMFNVDLGDLKADLQNHYDIEGDRDQDRERDEVQQYR